jgi:hypothetical protein
MFIDCNKYKLTLDKVDSHMVGVLDSEIASHPNNISYMTGVPVVAVCLYLITFIHPRGSKHYEYLNSRYESIIDFYGYTTVLPFEQEEIT